MCITLHRLLASRGITPIGLARLGGMSRATAHRLLAGGPVRVSVLADAARVLRVSYAELRRLVAVVGDDERAAS